MYSKTKKASCLMLAVLVLFCACADVLTQPAEAVDPFTLTIAGIGSIIMIMAGYTFSTAGAMASMSDVFSNASEGIYRALQELQDNFDIDAVTGKIRFLVTKEDDLMWLNVAINLAKEYFGTENGSLSVQDKRFETYNDVNYLTYDAYMDCISSDTKLAYKLAPYSENDVVTLSLNGVDYVYSLDVNADYIELLCNGERIRYYWAGWTETMRVRKVSSEYRRISRFGFYLDKEGDGLCCYLVVLLVDLRTGLVSYEFSGPGNESGYQVSHVYPFTAERVPSITSVPYERYGNVQTGEETEVKEPYTVEFPAWVIPEEVAFPNGRPDPEPDSEEENQPYVPFVPDLTWLKDLWDKLNPDATVEPVDENTGKDTPSGGEESGGDKEGGSSDSEDPLNVPQLPDLRDKFPFCVPFDLIGCFQALNAKPEAPRFVVPLVYEPLDFSYDIVIDFAPFEKIAVVCRWVCTFSFLVFLALVTRKIIQA